MRRDGKEKKSEKEVNWIEQKLVHFVARRLDYRNRERESCVQNVNA